MKFAFAFAGLSLLVSSAAWANDAQLQRGKELFVSKAVPACAVCHTLKDAGSQGAIGPNLDELKPSADRIMKVLKDGMGAMPSFANSLSQEDMEAVTAYVVKSTGQ
ncbi:MULTISPECIES: cytochrome c [Alcaligenaceae]|jgi:mono/diheme cytochrome c family protein|uniref:Sulfide dehydrogenase n=1 Tax=Neopusillimonas maritima TaxID=2026239 RepID=A0A3A1YZ45_9BURK|nr:MULTISPECIES: cytochrome c [Alcaligenaceae]QIM48867.1 cytochrome c [Pusillimonas sp. DMV24BSW_D]RII84342.1 sulfide dehydrogenase [Neopusillimonas maritima]RIY42080.1 sulfide dehydrogenase [Neopusillimonas maritima]|tara:strand:- start:2445 stop:2762 length:318 start_codon:yes stop_codon:yes gene_type:complete